MAAIAKAGTSGIEQRGDARTDQQLRSILFDSIRRSELDRKAVAARMSRLSGMVVSLNALNNWCAPGRENARMPAILVPAFCQACGDDRALRFLLGAELLKLLQLGEHAAAVLSAATSQRTISPPDGREERRA
jgi:hypothetical protein